jgi:hypothetical protein
MDRLVHLPDRAQSDGLLRTGLRAHQLSPDATFTDWVLVTMATDRGHRTLTPESFLEVTDGSRRERSISEREWRRLLGEEFSIGYHTG